MSGGNSVDVEEGKETESEEGKMRKWAKERAIRLLVSREEYIRRGEKEEVGWIKRNA